MFLTVSLKVLHNNSSYCSFAGLGSDNKISTIKTTSFLVSWTAAVKDVDPSRSNSHVSGHSWLLQHFVQSRFLNGL